MLNLRKFVFCLLLMGSVAFGQSSTIVTEQQSSTFQTVLLQYGSSLHTSSSPVVYINPLTTLIQLELPSLVTTQVFILPGTNRQKIIVYGRAIAGKPRLVNADAPFYIGTRDRWEAEFYSNKWIEVSRTDLEF